MTSVNMRLLNSIKAPPKTAEMTLASGVVPTAVSKPEESFAYGRQIAFVQDFMPILESTLVASGFTFKGERKDYGDRRIRVYLDSDDNRAEISFAKYANGDVISNISLSSVLNETLISEWLEGRIVSWYGTQADEATKVPSSAQYNLLMYALLCETVRKAISMTTLKTSEPTFSALASITQKDETAKVFAKNRYLWYKYSGAAVQIKSTNGKRVANFQKGYIFGIRAATSAASQGKCRMITQEHGETIVFTLTAQTANKLVSKSKVIGNNGN